MTRRSLIPLVSAGMAAALALAACTSGGSGGSGDKAGDTGSDKDQEASTGETAIKVAFVPKLQGIPYFEEMDRGGQAAAEEYGFEWLYQGPTSSDAAAQADVVRSFIQQGVDTLIVAPNDPDSLAPLLQEAQEKGIRVATSDTDAPNSVREVFVNQTTTENHGTTLAVTLAEAMGEKGKYAIVSCGETASNLNAYIDAAQKTMESEYPEIEFTQTVYAGEDQAKAAQMATDLMNADPGITGLIGICASAAPAVGQAVQDAGRVGEVFTVGGGTPLDMKPYLEDGSSSGSVLWNVFDLGYLTGWAGWQLALGEEFPEDIAVGDLSGVQYDPDTGMMLLGGPFVFTKENVGEFDY